MAQYKIIGADGKEYGPVSPDQLRQWLTEGRINAQTQAQADDRPAWNPLGSYPEFATAPDFATSAAASTALGAGEQDYQVEVKQWIRAGWELYKSRRGLVLGVTLLTLLLMMVGGAIPLLGGIVAFIIDGPLMGGLYLTILRIKRNEATGVGDIFDGFRRAFGQLILAHLIPTLIAAVFLIPGVIGLVIGLVMCAAHHASQSVGITIAVIGGVVLLAGFCVTVYLSTCWIFTIPLVADKQLSFGVAMKLSRRVIAKHWWGWMGFGLVTGLVVLLGILGCGIGILFTMPIAFTAWICAYEALFTRPATPAA